MLDEPTAGVDPQSHQRIWEMLEEHGQLDMIVESERAGDFKNAQLAVRQVLSNPPTLADRIVVLNFGSKIAEGTPQEIRNDRAVIDAYLGEAA